MEDKFSQLERAVNLGKDAGMRIASVEVGIILTFIEQARNAELAHAASTTREAVLIRQLEETKKKLAETEDRLRATDQAELFTRKNLCDAQDQNERLKQQLAVIRAKEPDKIEELLRTSQKALIELEDNLLAEKMKTQELNCEVVAAKHSRNICSIDRDAYRMAFHAMRAGVFQEDLSKDAPQDEGAVER
jgi:septal ring factor EnvC (AmiA/AmiB activator)